MNVRGFPLILTGLLIAGCQSHAYLEKNMSEPAALSPRLQTLFARTEQVCFGRYVMEAPAEAKLLWGFQEFPGEIVTHVGAAGRLKEMAEAYRAKELAKSKTAEISYFGPGAIANSIQVRSFESDIAKQYGAEGTYTFVSAGPHLFEWSGGRKNADLIRALRPRDNADIPTAPGVCIDHGFVADASGTFQEIFGAGIHLPSFPDVSFSVDSNKRATVEDTNEGLLASIAEQKKDLGARYPKLTTLREGKRTVGVWQGEESLVRRADGTHDFEWEAVGKERSTLHPAWINAKMYSKVAANRIGAADAASLSDDEAIALWNRLLDGVRFRVNAPPTQTGAPVTVRSGEITPLSGMWRASLPPGHPQAAWVASKSAIVLQKGMPMVRFGLSPADEALVVWTWMGEASE